MAEMKARHAFGSLADVEKALQAGKINEYDILFLDGDTEPKIGWIDANGIFRLVENEADFSELEEMIAKKADAAEVEALEAEVAKKASAEDIQAVENAIAAKADAEKVETLEEQVAAKADAEKVEALETELATKVTAEEVEAKVEAKIDEVETKVSKYTSRMYEIVKAPDGTLVDYFDKEIRVMIPSATDFANLDNGINGAENLRYIECRVYAPDGAVKYRFNFGGTVGEGNVEDFANCTDEHGRVYIVTAPPIAYYDAGSAAWVYYGANSTTKHYIGWNHTAEWLNENGVVIASDSVKINLSNEDCHYAVEPYYVGEMMTDVEAKIETLVEEKIKEVESSYEVIEF